MLEQSVGGFHVNVFGVCGIGVCVCVCVCVYAWHAVRADSKLHSHAHRSMKWGARCSYTPGSCRCRWCAQGSVPWAPLTLPVPRTYENPPGLMIIPRVVTLFWPITAVSTDSSGCIFSRVFGADGRNSFFTLGQRIQFSNDTTRFNSTEWEFVIHCWRM